MADQVVRVLAAAGCPAIYLKGSAYLDTLYELDERPMSDIDLLIRPADRERSRSALEASGFRCLPPPAGRAHSWQHHYNWQFVPVSDTDILIEIHTELCQPGRFTIEYDGLWARAHEIAAGERRVTSLAPEDCVLYVAVHELKHSFDIDVSRREDIARVIARWGIDWDIALARARAWGIATGLYVTLRASRAAGVDIPAEVIEAVRPSAPRRRALDSVVDLDRGLLRKRPVDRRSQFVVMAATADRATDFVRFTAIYAGKRWRDLFPRYGAASG